MYMQFTFVDQMTFDRLHYRTIMFPES